MVLAFEQASRVEIDKGDPQLPTRTPGNHQVVRVNIPVANALAVEVLNYLQNLSKDILDLQGTKSVVLEENSQSLALDVVHYEVRGFAKAVYKSVMHFHDERMVQTVHQSELFQRNVLEFLAWGPYDLDGELLLTYVHRMLRTRAEPVVPWTLFCGLGWLFVFFRHRCYLLFILETE